ENQEDLKEKSKILSDISSFTKSKSIIVARDIKIENIGGIPIIFEEEIDEIENFRQLSSLIRERSS
ncbi:MAG: hypothetical protein QXY45_02585, partial [Candidatus Aenigmatarchaeota archaeon]